MIEDIKLSKRKLRKKDALDKELMQLNCDINTFLEYIAKEKIKYRTTDKSYVFSV